MRLVDSPQPFAQLLQRLVLALVAFFIIDRHPAKYTTRTIGYLNFAGCLPYALDIWRGGGVWDFDTVFEILTDPLSLLVMYAAAATGWVVFYATPPVVAAYLAVTSEIKVKSFAARQEELIEDWGRNVRHGAMGEELEENGADGDGEWMDWLEDDSDNQETLTAENEELSKRRVLLQQAMEGLNERERHILNERRLKDDPSTLEELSKVYNISRERVRQIEVRAFEKLQKAIRNAAVEQRLAISS